MNTFSSLEYAAYDPSIYAPLLQILATYITVLAIVGLAYTVLMLVARWKIFKKAGTGGWKAIVPFYSDYTMYKVAWKKKYFWFVLVLSILASVCVNLSGDFPQYSLVFALIAAVLFISVIVLEIKCQVKLAKAFRKGAGFAVGLILLPIVFYPILGFGGAKYRRKKRRKKALPNPKTEV